MRLSKKSPSFSSVNVKIVTTPSSWQGITMGKYKTKAIQTNLDIFTHIPAYSDISRYIQSDIIRHIQEYWEPCVTMTYSEPWQIQNQTRIQSLVIFRTLAYSEPWFVQNPGIFWTRGIFMTLICSEPTHI